MVLISVATFAESACFLAELFPKKELNENLLSLHSIELNFPVSLLPGSGPPG
jgi:hypothetical protein